MDFELSGEQKAFKRMAQDFVKRKVIPVVTADEKAHRFQRDLLIQRMYWDTGKQTISPLSR